MRRNSPRRLSTNPDLPKTKATALSAETTLTERARTSLDLLYQISRELAANLDLGDLLERILQLTMEN